VCMWLDGTASMLQFVLLSDDGFILSKLPTVKERAVRNQDCMCNSMGPECLHLFLLFPAQFVGSNVSALGTQIGLHVFASTTQGYVSV
jgi:hypothetical protein